jgi:hypothetical protein
MAVNPSPLAPVPGSTVPENAQAQNASGAPSHYTKLMSRMNSKSADPAFQPYGNRTYAPREVNGGAHTIKVAFEAHTEPSAGATLSNGRMFSPAINRSAPNFYMGAANQS